MLCTYGVIIFVHPCILFASYSILPCWLIVCFYMYCTSYECIQIFIVHRCMLYYIERLYCTTLPHPPSHGIAMMCLLTGIADLCSLSSVSIHYRLMTLIFCWCISFYVNYGSTSVLLVHEYRCDLSDDMYDEVLICLCSS